MKLRVGVVMDPIGSIKVKSDTSLALLLEAKRRKWDLFYMELGDLYLLNGKARGRTRELRVFYDDRNWYEFGQPSDLPLGDLDVILMRKDPPFDIEYIYATYILEQAENQGALVVNRPSALRDVNEKVYTTWFSDLCPPTLITRNREQILDFAKEQEEVVLKPLDFMGGYSIFVLNRKDRNLSVILDTITANGQRTIMVQRYLPEIKTEGDKRIFLIDGKPVPQVFTRIPQGNDPRANLAAGGKAVAAEFTKKDQLLCDRVGPVVKEKGLLFVGLDSIGGRLTEINITSPTGIRKLNELYDLSVEDQVLEAVENAFTQKSQSKS